MTAVPSIPIPDTQTVAVAVVCLLAGMTVPTAYAIERLNGFGRAVVSKLPYRPPPGMEAQEALEQAVEQGDGPADEQDAQDATSGANSDEKTVHQPEPQA